MCDRNGVTVTICRIARTRSRRGCVRVHVDDPPGTKIVYPDPWKEQMRRVRHASRAVIYGVALLVGGGTLSACATPAAVTPSPQDQTALSLLATVAGPTSGVSAAAITGTECWLPSAHLITATDELSASADDAQTTWKVLCRVHWVDTDNTARFQDTTCIGDFNAEPMLERCYRWTHYDQMPVFEDEPAVPAG